MNSKEPRDRKDSNSTSAYISDKYRVGKGCVVGSLTIEASLVIPIFLFTMFLVLSLINLLRFHLNLQEAVHQETRELALKAYSEWEATADTVKAGVLKRLDSMAVEKAPVKDRASGIDFSGTKLDGREVIEIRAVYQAQLPYDFLNLFDHQFAAKCVMHTYIGYEKGLDAGSAGFVKEEYVYITETGTVYHRNRECTYLRLSISEVARDKVKDLRNSSGHKYYPCEKCGKRAGNTVYITKDGTCYHSSLTCSGLKRTIRCVPISEVGGRGPCSRCGKTH